MKERFAVGTKDCREDWGHREIGVRFVVVCDLSVCVCVRESVLLLLFFPHSGDKKRNTEGGWCIVVVLLVAVVVLVVVVVVLVVGNLCENNQGNNLWCDSNSRRAEYSSRDSSHMFD